jgi:probable rRNA maturation factor
MVKSKAQLAQLESLAARRILALLKKAQAFPALKKKLPKSFGKSASRFALKATVVHFSLVSASEMKKLNNAWRKKNYATDVLSFSAPEVFFQLGNLGELVICLPVMKKQAREQKHSVEQELEVLLVHGILHLMGFDHELGLKEAKVMQKWESALLKSQAKDSGLISRVKPLKQKA